MCSKGNDTSGFYISPVLPTGISSHSLSRYLQEEYPEYFKRAFEKPDSDTESSECTHQFFHAVKKSDSSDSCADQCKVSGKDRTYNSNKCPCGQKHRFRSPTSFKRDMKGTAGVADKQNTTRLSFRAIPIALTKIIECALADLSGKLDIWLGRLKCDILRYAECLATHHHEHKLAQKVLRAWLALVQDKWKKKAEKSYIEKAEDTCRQMRCDYENKITVMKEEIDCLNKKLESMQQEQDLYARNVKQAFMRGICALNSETMPALKSQQIQKKLTKGTIDTCCRLEADVPNTCEQMMNSMPTELIISPVSDDYSSFDPHTVQEGKCKQSKPRSPLSTFSSVSLLDQRHCCCAGHYMACPVVRGHCQQITKKCMSEGTKSKTKAKQDCHSSASLSNKVFQAH